jgi:hypothetical protein
MTPAAHRWPFIAKIRLHFQVTACGRFWWPRWRWYRFFSAYFSLLIALSLTTYSLIHFPLTFYNRQSVSLTIDPKPLPNRVPQTVQSSASSFNFHYLLMSLRLPRSCLYLLLRLPVPPIFPPVTCFRRRCVICHILFHVMCILYCGCFNLFCNVWVCVCMGFVVCRCVYVWVL